MLLRNGIYHRCATYQNPIDKNLHAITIFLLTISFSVAFIYLQNHNHINWSFKVVIYSLILLPFNATLPLSEPTYNACLCLANNNHSYWPQQGAVQPVRHSRSLGWKSASLRLFQDVLCVQLTTHPHYLGKANGL